MYLVHLIPLASDQAVVCSTLIPIPWWRSCGLFHALGTCVFGSVLFLMLPAAGAAHWILLSPARTADNKRNGRWEEKCVGGRLLRFLPSGLPFTCSSPMYHARAVYISINSDVNNLAILTELLKQRLLPFCNFWGTYCRKQKRGSSRKTHNLHLLGSWVTDSWPTQDLQRV